MAWSRQPKPHPDLPVVAGALFGLVGMRGIFAIDFATYFLRWRALSRGHPIAEARDRTVEAEGGSCAVFLMIGAQIFGRGDVLILVVILLSSISCLPSPRS